MNKPILFGAVFVSSSKKLKKIDAITIKKKVFSSTSELREIALEDTRVVIAEFPSDKELKKFLTVDRGGTSRPLSQTVQLVRDATREKNYYFFPLSPRPRVVDLITSAVSNTNSEIRLIMT